MTHVLYPPLALISNDLFGAEPADDVTAPPSYVSNGAGSAPPMPDFLLQMIRRRTASDAAYPPAPPAVGQIRRLDRIPAADSQGRPLGRSGGVLLGAGLGGQCWSGWMVAQEVDYATDRDLVLQEEDGPFAPEAAMVQAWNPVRVVLRGDEAILGKLSAEYLGAVHLLADSAAVDRDFVAPRPGCIGAWNLDGHTIVVTGTPLGDATDPRHAYQRLYHDLAQEICVAAAASSPAGSTFAPEVPRPGLLDWLRRTFVTPGWALAALAVVLFQGVWILAPLVQTAEEEGIYRGNERVRSQDDCGTRIRIVIKPQASYADAIVTLRRIGATITDGPSETGELWISIPRDQSAQEAAGMLKQSHLVEEADVIEGDKRHCGK